MGHTNVKFPIHEELRAQEALQTEEERRDNNEMGPEQMNIIDQYINSE